MAIAPIAIAAWLWFSASAGANSLLDEWNQPEPTTATEAVQQYIQSLQRNRQVMDLQLDYYEDQLNTANQRLAELETALGKERQQYAPQMNATIARLRFLQQQSLASRGWSVLLKSENLNEFFDRRDRLRQLYQADRDRLAQLQQVAQRLFDQKTALEQQQAEITTITTQIQAQTQDLEAQLQLQQQLLANDSDRATLQAAQTQLSQDSAQLEALIQQWNAPSDGPNSGTGTYILPHHGEISDTYGWRKHPVLGRQRLHAGIDFKGPYGSPIQAADAGVVAFAGWYGGYGRTVVIEHGDGFATLYGHTNKMLVTVGQPVEQGEAIAEVGSTGLSTGPHLHFELRQNGKPIDPVPYLRP
ncbi:peptidoglycan DD-metalloendopeptidase family protein [Spirulina subsalsa CS-330]|uniref:murein hydrolase activator EnvC family protein n=1 Tax=Spirulina subsalsa TaxID=54311 RepID=UPI00232B05FB|nr:M23 family metallopeptidase [Spirulina subsalsa]MDB9493581.1 peptidoglycan DD-metalloendopeptidase family protein [Spirulina subsalsa CS-330]